MSECLNFNGVFVLDEPTVIVLETNTFTTPRVWHCREQLRSKQELFESILPCLFVLYSLAHSLDRNFFYAGSTDLSASTQI